MERRRITIKTRIVVLSGLLFVASLLLSGTLIYRSELNQLKDGLQDYGESESRLLQSIVAFDTEGLDKALAGFGRIDSLLRTFAARDKSRLQAVAEPIFMDVRRNNNITHMYFIDPDGTVFLRVHKPEQSGDKLSRATFVKAAATQHAASGIEMGMNFFSLRAVRPISLRGRPIGYLEIAEEIDHVFDHMKSINGSDVSLFLTDTYVKENSSRVHGEKSGDFIALYATERATSLKLAAQLQPEMSRAVQSTTVKVVDLDGRSYAVGLGPFKDAFGKTAGILVSHKEVTAQYAAMWKEIRIHLLMVAVTMALGMLVLLLSFRKSFAMFNSLKRNMEEITTEWDLSRSLVIATNDEIGDMAGMFNLTMAELNRRQSELQRHVSEQRLAIRLLHESEQRFSTLFNSSVDAIFLFDFKHCFIEVNDTACTRLGYSRAELLAMTLRDINTPEYAALMPQRFADLRTHTSFSYETAHVAKDGTIIPVDVSARVIDYEGKEMVLAFAKDISRRKQAEEEHKVIEQQLVHTQKMESIGTLAGGIAHDFNNILTVILGVSCLVHMKMQEDDPLRENLQQIIEAGEKAARLTRSLLTFSRKQRLTQNRVLIRDILLNMEEFLKRIIGDDVQLQISCNESDMRVYVDIGQIEQVIMNLIANARDAMPKGGCVQIEADPGVIDDQFIHNHGYGVTGRYVIVTVTDTGTGMEQDVMDKLFEPFFTTKECGKGTGLGLSIAHGIIKQHNGYIQVESEVGKGTTFRIYLPLIVADLERTAVRPKEVSFKGSETILVAEDDRDIRDLQTIILSELGYTVIEAVDGVDALQRFSEHKNDIHLLLFDMMMPKKSGIDAYAEIRLISPDLPVLFFSGLSADLNTGDIPTLGGVEIIYKPIRPRDLARKVREVLDGKRASVQA